MGPGMASSNGFIMVYRLSLIAGIAGSVLALARVQRLLRPSIDGLPWEIVLVAAAAMGAAITWAGLAYRVKGRWVALVNLVVTALVVIRISVPATTWGIFPTSDSFGELRAELEFARDVIRSGVAPVIPIVGVIAVLAAVFWALGALVVWGALRRHPYVAALAPMVLYLQFATMDRAPAGTWTVAFVALLGVALLAVAFDRRRVGTGQLTSHVTQLAVVRTVPALAIASLALVLIGTVAAADAMAELIPRQGVLAWRASSGLTGEYYGSVTYNPFVGIRQGLVSQSNVPVFVAEIEGDIPLNEVYWRMLSLDTFNGSQWFANQPQMSNPEDLDVYESSNNRFRGPTTPVVQRVTVLALQMDWLPAAYAPRVMTASNRAVDRGFRVKTDDASLRLGALSFRGMDYTVVSDVPMPDLAVLSVDDEGGLSTLFATAAADGEYSPEEDAQNNVVPLFELPNRQRYLTLPTEISPSIRRLAKNQVSGLTTDFEKGLALEAFFRRPGNFRYSTAIAPGHGAEDLADWLLAPDSPNYRIGYCEQFSTSMAVMARMLDIPSRVVLGFTPGTRLDDGRALVRDRNAHAWLELWMPSQGWVRFDPTPRPDSINPSTTGDLPFDISAYLAIPDPVQRLPNPGVNPGPIIPHEDLFDIPPFVGTGGESRTIPTPQVPRWVLWFLASSAIVFGLLPAIKTARRRRRLRRLGKGDISAAWAEIVDRLSDLGAGPETGDTPLEFAASAEKSIVPLAEVYTRATYGPVASPSRPAVIAAERSLVHGEAALNRAYPLGKRIIARYRLRSLAPDWWSRRRS